MNDERKQDMNVVLEKKEEKTQEVGEIAS